MEHSRKLPNIMIAPNGARRMKTDHPQLPLTIPELVEATLACVKAGADGLHMHVRDTNGQHTLDAGLYLEAMSEIKTVLPQLYIQITTEAVGQYSPMQQRDLVKNIEPEAVSISIAEMLADGEVKEAIEFYNWCQDANIKVQHIIYGPEDLEQIEALPLLNNTHLQLLFVLGRYTKNQVSKPEDLKPFYDWLTLKKPDVDWAICAFGQGETDCLIEAHKHGGKIRIGFENSLWNRDGYVATDNTERVVEIVGLLNRLQ